MQILIWNLIAESELQMLEEVLVNGSGTGLHEILLLAKLLKTYTKGDSIFL